MSDEKIENGGGTPAGPAKGDGGTQGKPSDGDHNTNTMPPEVEGGQPPVGDDLPRDTEF